MSKAPIIHNESEIFVLSDMDIERLKSEARHSPLNRARINVHRHPSAKVQEMVIALTKDCVFQPHRHLNKSESFHIVEGEMIIMIFDDFGKIIEAILLCEKQSNSQFDNLRKGRYYRLDSPRWHSVLPLSDEVIFHETTTGPFIQGQHELSEFIKGSERTIKQFYMNSLEQLNKSEMHIQGGR